MSSISEKLKALRAQASLESEEPTVNVEVDVTVDDEVVPTEVPEETEAAAESEEGADSAQEEPQGDDEDLEAVVDPEADSAVAESVLETAEVNEQVLQEEVTEQERLAQIEEAEDAADEVEELASDLEAAGKDGLSVESFNLLKGQVKRIAKRFGASFEELGLQVIENAEQSLTAEVPDAPEATEPEVLPEFTIATENDEVEVEAEAEAEVEEEVPTEEADDEDEIEIVDEDEVPTADEEGAVEPTPEVPEQDGPRVELALTKDEVKISVESLRTLARGLRVGASQLEAGNEAWGEGGIGRLFTDEENILFVRLTGKFKKLSENTFPTVITKFNRAVESIKAGEKDADGLFIRASSMTLGYKGDNNEKAIYDGAKAITSVGKGFVERSIKAVDQISAVTKRLLEKGEKSESVYRKEISKVLETIIPIGYDLPHNSKVTAGYVEDGKKAIVGVNAKGILKNGFRFQLANFSDVRPMLNVLEDAKQIATEFAAKEAKGKEFKKRANAAFSAISETEEFRSLEKDVKKVIKNGFMSTESLLSTFSSVLLNWSVAIALTGKSIYRSKGK